MMAALRHNPETGGRGTLHAVAVSAAVLASGCTLREAAPEEIELANMRPSNVIPKSSPRQFVSTFEQFCTDMLDTPDRRDALLRAADYVPTTSRPRNGARLYLVDDRRPAVIVIASPGSIGCTVMAEPRTGQTDEVRRWVAREFPAATARAPSQVGPGGAAEEVWTFPTGAGQLGSIFTMRDGPFEPDPQYTISVVVPN